MKVYVIFWSHVGYASCKLGLTVRALVLRVFFSEFLMGGLKIVGPRRGPMGTNLMGTNLDGGNLRKKSD